MTPIHWLNLYEKPAQGSAFIRRLPTFNYRHTIAANGGFDTASCAVILRNMDEAAVFIEQHIGSRVAFYVNNPAAPIWEGLINRMTFEAGGVAYTISLDEMYNRARVFFSNNVVGLQASAYSSDADSQAVYGIKAGNVDLNFYNNGGTRYTKLASLMAATYAWPLSSITLGGDDSLVQIEMIGFYHTLKWEEQWSSPGGAVSASGAVLYALTKVLNTMFFDPTDTSAISTNAAFNESRDLTAPVVTWEWLKRIQEAGDGSWLWVIGITPTDSQGRRLYYKAANSTVEYTARRSDRLRIRNLCGRLVPPWTVQPDRVIRVTDWLAGWNGLGDDPRETYIDVIEYDAESQTVEWRGADDTSVEGAMRLRNVDLANVYGKRFGMPLRQARF